MEQFRTMINQAMTNGAAPQQGAPGQSAQGAGLSLDSFLTGKGGLATGAAAGGLVGLLLGGKKGRKMAGSAVKLGGVALVGGLAYKAFRDWQQQKAQTAVTPAEPVARETFLPTGQGEQETLSRTIIRAMISAAQADGHIDEAERERILGQAEAVGLDTYDQGFIARELARPASMDDLVAEARSPEIATEIYMAALLAVDAEGDTERAWLHLLKTRLRLDDDLVTQIHAAADQQLAAA
ncbi:tellurite resistance TerB family protein [Parvularcula sp. IMCC14364]|uniref:tellurite resistance TerB family protein n=1 Tax=Parvularcula sp. IMCC14364 TaxID=3067902 RepID=UPI002742759B|nr:tellurite resistance TerB family protein [Parvularcula sp. IMCC14364]